MSAVSPTVGDVLHTASGGGPGGGNQIPPPPQIDGPAWYMYNASAEGGSPPSPNINFDAIPNTVQGAISIGQSRTATELVYNVSKKTPLTLTQITIVGTNAAEFSIPATTIQLALNNPIPANRGQGIGLAITFTPTAQGVRTGTLRLVSNAGTALISLTGTALPPRPIIATASALSFIPENAPSTLTITNNGGQGLILNGIALGGTNPGSFEIVGANHGQGNCYPGVELAAHSYCFVGVGPVAGAPTPSSATLVILSNDPVHPETDVALTLTQ